MSESDPMTDPMSAPTSGPYRTPAQRYYLLGLLAAITAVSNLDKLALGVFLQNIKHDLHLSDTQLGVLGGIAFALFYSVLGLPLARWADRGRRIKVIWASTALWAVMVALCATARSFSQLLLIRIGVAVGEAGCLPASQSVISQVFPRAQRPRAIAIYAMITAELAIFIGYFGAGWLNELYGWRTAFLILCIPGGLLAALVAATLREPQEPTAARAPLSPHPPPSFITVLGTLLHSRTFLHLCCSFCISGFFSYGIVQWQPAFFARSYHLSSGALGSWLALIYGLPALLGAYCGGAFASRYLPGNERAQLKLVALSNCAYTTFAILAYLSHHLWVSFGLIGLAGFASAAADGPIFATIQTLVAPRLRATAVALLYLLANLIGMGLGPLGVGMLSDLLHRHFGAESLRYSLLILAPGYLWSAAHLLAASRTVLSDIARTAREEEGAAALSPAPLISLSD